MRKLLVLVGVVGLLALSACGDDTTLTPGANADGIANGTDATLGEDAAADATATTDADATTPDATGTDADVPPADLQTGDATDGDTAQTDGDTAQTDGDTAQTDADATIADASDAATGTDATVDDAADAAPGTDAIGNDAADAATPDVGPDTAPQCLTANDCDDNNPCSTDTCDAGTCNHAAIANCVPPPAACDASHPCATGKCDPVAHACVACLASADCGAGFLCEANVCVDAPGCKSDVDCKTTKQVCSIADGVCVDCNANTDCGVYEACTAHKCVAAPPCKSSKDCIAVCDTVSGTCVDCMGDSDCKAEQFCNLTNHTCTADVCTGAGCSGNAAFTCLPNGSGFGASIGCDDGNACTDDACKLGIGCTHTNNSAPCTDGSACTINDTCSAGACVGLTLDCDDKNVCTADSCSSATGCVHVNVAGTCNDGLLCTANDACAAGTCVGAAISCDDGKQCTADSCIEGSGCAHTDLTGTQCTDGNGCTGDDQCAAGACVGGAAPNCDDNNPCTTDSCDVALGCVHANADGGICDDSSVCTVNDVCGGGICGGTAVVCDDQNLCTDNKCDPTSSCLFTQNTVQCNDGNACTTGDICAVGKCASGAAVVCDDNNSCTADSCDPTTGCVFAATSGATCDDGDFCTIGDVCTLGVCGGAPNLCDDGNACTTDTCSTNACANTNAVDGTACGTFDGCTGDFCTAGSCLTASSRLWEKTVDAPSNNDIFSGAARTSDGGFIFAGETAVQSASQNGWLVKVDGGGTTQWAKSYGGNSEDRLRGVVANADGSIIGVGAHGGNGGDGWLLKVDSTGATQIDATFGAAGGDQFRAIAAAPAGGWIAVGNKSVAQFPNFYTDDGWLMRFAADGGQTWEKTFGSGQAGDTLYGVVALADGSFVGAGSRGVNAGFGTGWLLKVDANGAQVWSRTYNQGFGVDFRGVTTNGNGFAVVGWSSNNNGTDGLLQFAGADGNGTSQRLYNKSQQDYLLGISPIPTGGFVLTGQQSGSNGTAWFLRADASGNEQWSKTWGGNGTDVAYAVQVEADLTAIVAGVFSGSNADGFARHIDLFGNASCGASGTCISKLPNDCDDANPCTLDQCGNGVCSHQNLANGTLCNANGDQCDNGSCQPN